MGRTIHDPGAVASFHHLHGAPPSGAACRGLACFACRADNPGRWAEATARRSPIYCLGLCHVSPAAAGETARPSVRVESSEPVLLENVAAGGVRDLATYLSRGGGDALNRARSMPPEALIETIVESGLSGRGGAGFPAGRKWASVRAAGGDPVIVVNADEGDPGAFSDKALLEDDPFRLIEAIGIVAHAIGAREAVIYLRCEYPEAGEILAAALREAGEADWPGAVHIELTTGRGSFVCGEETSLLNSLEGRRPMVRIRPPYPNEQGLYGRPTLVQNVETLCAAPWIVERGGAAFRDLGAGAEPGVKLISLNAMFREPGLVEIPMGIPVRRIIEEIGGGVKRGRFMGVMIGGPLAGLLPPSALDTPFAYSALASVGGAVGHGGVIAFADDTDLASLIAEVFRFGAGESCGLCAPCRLGTAELAGAFECLCAGERGVIDSTEWGSLIAALEQTSLCGHGRGLAEFARSLEKNFPEELAACLR